MIETEFTISQQHPSLAGHFPGNPIVPGVVILDEVLRCIRENMSACKLMEIPSVKFLSPLLPGVRVRLNIAKKQDSLLSFSCRVEDTLICSGQIRLTS